MEDIYGECSNRMASNSGSPSEEDVMLLASSCPKKRAGRIKFKETRHPVYRGVRQRNGNRWVCEVRTPVDNSRIWLGTYATAEMAARAHDVAALALRGKMACLNFADSAWRLPVPVSTDTKDIQRAAAEAGEAFISMKDNVMGNGVDNEAIVPELLLSSVYMDEEAVFNMPILIDNMAQGLLLPPPSDLWGYDDHNEGDCEVSLWDY